MAAARCPHIKVWNFRGGLRDNNLSRWKIHVDLTRHLRIIGDRSDLTTVYSKCARVGDAWQVSLRSSRQTREYRLRDEERELSYAESCKLRENSTPDVNNKILGFQL